METVASIAVPSSFVDILSDAVGSGVVETCGCLFGRVSASRVEVLEWSQDLGHADESSFEIPIRLLRARDPGLRTVGIFHTHLAAPAAFSVMDFWSMAMSPFVWLVVAGATRDGRPQLGAYRPCPTTALNVEVAESMEYLKNHPTHDAKAPGLAVVLSSKGRYR